jgi:microsomal dipeptidase-like Zn-dependent dipeptidase
MKNFYIFFSLFIFSMQLFSQTGTTDQSIIEKARKIHKKVITIDTHIDINVKNFTDQYNYTKDLHTQVNLPKMEKGGLDVAFFIVYSGQKSLDEKGYANAYKNALAKFNAIHELTEVWAPDRIGLALNSADVRRIHKSGKLVAMIGVENAYPIGTDMSNFKKFYDLGARYISLSHQGHSQFCDSNTGEKDDKWLYDNGLSELGKQAVKEMNRLGIMIDVSHPSKGSFMEIIKLTNAPIIASHSGARALCNHSRNLDDEQLLLLKKNGGVAQAVAFAGYVNAKKNNAYRKAQSEVLNKVAEENNFKILGWGEREKLNASQLEDYNTKLDGIKKLAEPALKEAAVKYPPVDVKDFVDHIDHMVKLIGINHVGISSDFDGGGGISGWNNASETFNVTLELVRRGYTEKQIAKLWGENLLRVLDDVQRIAKKQ